jgi:hypothetical protein
MYTPGLLGANDAELESDVDQHDASDHPLVFNINHWHHDVQVVRAHVLLFCSEQLELESLQIQVCRRARPQGAGAQPLAPHILVLVRGTRRPSSSPSPY